jgi:2-iminobutanoate/2-iminopropanoate deaminase
MSSLSGKSLSQLSLFASCTALGVAALLWSKSQKKQEGPKTVETKGAPSPAGHYSQGRYAFLCYSCGTPLLAYVSSGVVHGGMLYVSGQLPIDPAKPAESKQRMQDASYPIDEQTTRCLESVLAIIEAAGGSMDNVVKTTVYVSSVELWPAVNAAYSKFFTAHTEFKPARAVVPSNELHFGFQVEVEAVVALN